MYWTLGIIYIVLTIAFVADVLRNSALSAGGKFLWIARPWWSSRFSLARLRNLANIIRAGASPGRDAHRPQPGDEADRPSSTGGGRGDRRSGCARRKLTRVAHRRAGRPARLLRRGRTLVEENTGSSPGIVSRNVGSHSGGPGRGSESGIVAQVSLHFYAGAVDSPCGAADPGSWRRGDDLPRAARRRRVCIVPWNFPLNRATGSSARRLRAAIRSC